MAYNARREKNPKEESSKRQGQAKEKGGGGRKNKKEKAQKTPGIEPDVGVEPTTLRLRVSRSTD